MAGLKKPKKKDGAKPGTVLIMFLVFFILLSIGLGVWGYYGYEGQAKLREDAKKARADLTAQKNLDDYRIGLIQLLATAVGAEVAEADRPRAKQAIDEIIKDGGRYQAEHDHKIFAGLVKDVRTDLPLDEANAKFRENYRDRTKKLKDELQTAQAQLASTQEALKKTQQSYQDLQKKQEELFATTLTTFNKGNAAALAAAKEKYDAMNKMLELNQKIQSEKLELETKVKNLEEKLGIEIARFAKMMEQKKENNVEIVQGKRDAGGDIHALFLDISRGIPLWDRALGKVTRVNLEKREAYINLGASHDVRPGLTFNVFADDGKGHADRFLKATIEVVRVIDNDSSLARITSLYDGQGRQIALNEQITGRIAREIENPVREGDLLYNMFWNTHVAIAGAVNLDGPVGSPAEQMRQLDSFRQALERMGIHVDAVLDLTDGKLQGSIGSKTRFLVLGEAAITKGSGDEAQQERTKQINDAMAALRKEALDKGLFMISAENFAIATGYRTLRSASNHQVGSFRSSPILTGSPSSGLVIYRDRPVIAPMAEMKE